MYRNLYKEILNNINFPILATEDTGKIIFCNSLFAKYFNLSSDEILNKNIKDKSLFQSDNYNISLVFKEKKELSLFQKSISGKNILLSITPILDDTNSITLITVTIKEIKNSTNSDLPFILNSNEDDSFIDFQKMPAFKNIDKIATFDVTVLLLGESGTGKSTCAKFIHNLSSRHNKPFFTINCTTIPENLIESELFGYVKGAFTGATKDGKKGLVELANSGTLFLDEIGDLPLASQSKILELIENKTYLPVGSSKKKTSDIRIIAATNKDLKKMVSLGEFREDLYYRLNVIEFKIPPLRDHKDDIPLLANVFLSKLNKKYNLHRHFSKSVLLSLKTYDWPGNLRQLNHIIEKIVISNPQNEITLKSLEDVFISSDEPSIDNSNFPSLKKYLEDSERVLILSAYNKYKSSYKLAKVLDISQSQASRKIRKYISK